VRRAIYVDVMNSWIGDTSVAFGAFQSIGALEHFWSIGALERFWSESAGSFWKRWSVGAVKHFWSVGALEHILERWWSVGAVGGAFLERSWRRIGVDS
jgi:hypothetical protein